MALAPQGLAKHGLLSKILKFSLRTLYTNISFDFRVQKDFYIFDNFDRHNNMDNCKYNLPWLTDCKYLRFDTVMGCNMEPLWSKDLFQFVNFSYKFSKIFQSFLKSQVVAYFQYKYNHILHSMYYNVVRFDKGLNCRGYCLDVKDLINYFHQSYFRFDGIF